MAHNLSILNDPPKILNGPQLLHELISWDEHAETCALDFVKKDHRQQYTYRQFQSCYKSLVARILELLSKHSAEAGQQHIVPLLVPQSPGLYISQLAILSSGGAFCPLNLDSPVERLKFNVNDVQANFVITTQEFKSQFTWENGPDVILVEEFPELLTEVQEDWKLSREISPDDLAYVMYTSGSSGTPKGVGVSHLAVSQSLLAHELFLPKFERFLQFAAPSFDVSVFEIYFPLKRGKTLVGCEKNELMNDLPGMITRLEVDAAELTPGVAGSLLEKRAHAPGLKLLLTIGEMLTTPVVEEFGGSESQHNMLYGMYGPTEAAIHCTVFPKMEADARPGNIGVPFETVSTFIATPSTSVEDAANLTFVPVGELGELVLGGPQLARGYLNREDQNKLAFVQFEDRHYYRTGDKARQLINGTIEILGRISSGQVKLRGQRIELGEVEEAVYKHPGVKTVTAAVVDNSLVVYALTRDQSISASEIIETCAKWLPKYMLPSDVVILKNFPYLPSGKIDKNKLTSDYREREQTGEEPNLDGATETQLAVKNTLQDVLGAVRFPTRLAGAGLDSLMAIRVAAKLRALGYNVTTIAVLQAETFISLVSLCEDSKSIALPTLSPIRGTPVEDVSPALNGNAKHLELTMPCTSLQSAMLAETAAVAQAYRNWIEIELANMIEVSQVIQSLNELAHHNPILRTGFIESKASGSYQQIIWNNLDNYNIKEVETFNYDFNLLHDVSLHRPVRIQILKCVTTIRILIHIHHALYDAWSLELLLDDLNTILMEKPLPQRPSFRVVVDSYQNGLIDNNDWALKDYWKDHLEHLDFRGIPSLYAAKPPPPALTVAYFNTSLSTTEVENTARSLSVSPHTLFQAAHCLILGSFLGTTDLCFGTVFSGRTLPIPGIEDIVGPCLATLPIRIDTSTSETLEQLVKELNSTNRKHLENSTLPLKDIKSAAGAQPGQHLFDTLVIWQQTLHSLDYKRQFVSLVDTVDNLEFNLTLEVTPGVEKIALKANYQQSLLPKKQIIIFFQLLEHIVKLIIEKPSTPVDGCFAGLDHTALSIENENPQTSLKTNTLSSPVEAIAAEDPHRLAIEFADSIDENGIDSTRTSYAELNNHSNRIGRYLIEQDVLPDELVCIVMEKCVDLYASILAVSKIGAGYLPQTPDVPHERLQHILQEANIKTILAHSSSRSLLKLFNKIKVVYVDTFDFSFYSTENIPPRSLPEHISYCVYTSGSTGTPKGVLVTQGNLLSNLDVLEELYPRFKNSRLLQQCSQTFDVSVFEIFFTWRIGGCICSAVKDVLFRDLELAIRSLSVTHLSMTPSVAALVDPKNVPSVEFLVTAGEAVTRKVKNAWQDRGLWQGYGPSETTNICTVKPRVTSHDAINIIGPPFSNTSAFVLFPGTAFSPVPRGGVGEFVFGGSQVFRGYMDQTKEIGKIIDHPKFGRLYRSGDYGRMLSDGSLAFTGRKDDQVKIRGQRVELGEINSVILKFEAVRDCVTMIIDGRNGEQRLVSFWAVASDTSHEVKVTEPDQFILKKLYENLESTLPPYMIPSLLIPISRLPSTTQGKIDKQFLVSVFRDLGVEYLNLVSQGAGSSSGHSFSSLEKQIAEAVATVTKSNIDQIGSETSFFNLGIDSISAISLSRTLRQDFQHNVEISEILKNPTVARLAIKISQCNGREDPPVSGPREQHDFGLDSSFKASIKERFINAGRAVQAIYPCTPLQEAMLSAGQSSSLQLYDNQVIFDVVGDAEKLQNCWRAMVQRHEILRTCFVSTDLPRHPFVQVVLDKHDLVFSSGSNHQSESDELQPPYSIVFYNSENLQKLTISMHHALYDGVAVAVLYEEVEMLYKGLSLPPAVSPEPFLTLMASEDMASSDRFWGNTLRNYNAMKFSQLNGKSDLDQLLSSQSHGRVGKCLRWIEANAKKHSTSLLAVCHTVWAGILAELHQEHDICFGNVVSGRTAAVDGIERLVAPCFNTIPVRLAQADKISYLEAFRKFQNLNADSLPFQLTPLRRIQSKFSPDGSRLFDTLFILQQPSRSLDSSIWSISDDTGAMDFPLVCEIVPNQSDDTLDIILHSYTSYFTSQDVSNILNLIQSNIEYALENPRRQLLSAALKEQIVAKADARTNVAQASAHPRDDTKTVSPEELKLRNVISQFTEISSDKIGRHVSLFRLGLDSISIVQVATRLKKKGYHVNASDILVRPTIAQLGVFLSESRQAPLSVNTFDFEIFDSKHRGAICLKNKVEAEDIESVRPCTSVQQGMLATTLHSGGHEYVNSVWYEISPEMSISDLKNAWSVVCNSHEILRTGFISVDDPKYAFAMITFNRERFRLPWHDVTNSAQKSPTLESLLYEPWKLSILKEGDTHLLCFTAHHALYDAQSIQLILADVSKILEAQTTPNRASAKVLLEAILQSSELEQQEKETFWTSAENKIVVNRFPDLTPLQVAESASLVREVVSTLTISELEAECRKNGVTIQAATQAVWGRLLTAYIGETSTTFGMTLSGRSVHEQADQISFPSIVTVPVRCDITGTNAELLARTMNHNAALHRHQFTSLTSIQKWAGYPEGKIFDTLFAYQKVSDNEHQAAMPWKIVKEEASVDYTISMEVQPSKAGEVVLRLTFRQDIIPSEHAEILLRQYDTLLIDTLMNPTSPCDTAPSTSEEGIISITPAIEDVLPGSVRLLHDFVTLGAQQLPNKIALEFATNLEPGNFDSKKWTYQELDHESNKVANYLLSRGVVPGDMVAICFDKCAEASFAIIGIMKAGCAYVALDPTAPDERSKFIVEDSAAKMILSRGKPAERLKIYMEKDIVAFDSPDILEGCAVDAPKLSRDINPKDTSYCLYTSGTTGTPKGCLITHDNTVQFMLAFSRLFAGHWSEDSKYLQFASFHFDVSVMEQFWSWSVGICVASAPRDLIFEDIPGAINMLGITHIDLTPSLARLIHPDTVPSLCKGAFITGGEQLKQEILDVWGEHAVIYNGYGPTEATIGCTMYPRVPKNGKPSNIGPAYINVGSFVLKPGTELPVLRGGIGELCVSGKLVGKGYLNRPDLTAERFPVLKEFNERVYRTGDLVRILHDGSFIFLGRADDQVKLRGQRLELSEINQVIKKSMKDIQEVVTLVLKHSAQQKEQLVTFFVLSSCLEAGEDGSVTATMREACKAKLPGYMVPTHFIPVKGIPLNANNKADAKQLGGIYNEIGVEYLQKLSQSGQQDKQWTESEKPVVSIIATALRAEVESVTRGANVFELGLDSISIIGFSRALQNAGLENAKLTVVKNNPSIGNLVQALMAHDIPNQEAESAYVAASQSIAAFAQRHIVGVCKELGVESNDIEAIAPCTPVQEGMIYRFLESEKAFYFNVFKLQLENRVNTEKLLAAWNRVVGQLEILRTVFVATDDGFAQVVQRVVRKTLPGERIDYDTADKSAALKTPYFFEVTSGSEVSIVTLRIFHGLYDGNSLTMMLRRLVDEYQGLQDIEHRPSFVSSLPFGPLAKMSGAENFWKEHLNNWVDSSMPISSDSTKDIVSASTIDDLTGFEHLRKALGVAPQAIIQAAWVSVLQNIISSNFTIGIVTSGRAIEYENADKSIGPLFNTIPFHVQIESGTTSAALIKECHDYNMRMQDFQHTPLKDIQKWGPSKPGQQLFDTLFVFQRPEEEDEDFAKGIWTQIEDEQIADYPLAFEATLSPDSTKLSLIIVAQGSAITEIEASELLQQVKDSLLTMIDSSGQNSILSGTTIRRDGSRLQDESPSTPPTTSSEAFAWTEKTRNIRDEISKLAGVSENSVLEHSSIFELGLDSIDVIKLASRLKKRGIDIPVSAIIKSQTIAKMITNISTEGEKLSSPTVKPLAVISNELKTYLKSKGRLPLYLEDVLPATPLQQSMVNEMIKSNYERYFNVDGFKLNSGIDLEKLMKAAIQVIERSPILRTTFIEVDDPKSAVSYAQIIHKSLPQFEGKFSVSRLPQGQSFESFMEHFKHVAILYAKQRQELLQLQAISIGESNYLVIAISHALYDGASLRHIHEDIQRAYREDSWSRPDFMPFLEQVSQSTTDDAKNFWRTILSDLPSAKFPTKELAGRNERNESTRLERRSRIPLSNIEMLCKSSRITLQTLGQTCWALVLSQLMGQLDVVFGSVLSCRDTEDAASVNFPLMNTVAVRSVLHGTLNAMMKYMQDNSDMTRQYQHFPLGTAQAYALVSRKDRDPTNDTTLFDTLFIYQGRRATQATGVSLYESVYGVADVEFPICVEMEIVDGEFLSWTTKCKSTACNAVETKGILDALETVLEHLVSMPQDQTFKSGSEGVSVCGLSPFKTAEILPKTTIKEAKSIANDRWSETELSIRKALHQISDVPEESIGKDTTIFHLGLDSILILKLPALLKTYEIKLSVSSILKDQTIHAMALSAGDLSSVSEVNTSLDVDAVIKNAMGDLDIEGAILGLEQEGGEVQYVMPATAGQVYMIRNWQSSRGAMFYQTFTYTLPASLNRSALEAAWKTLVARHDILRTGFLEIESKIVQIVYQKPENEVIYHSGDQHASTRKQRDNLKMPPVNLVVERDGGSDGSNVIIKLVLHHVLYDGISLPILIEELQALYNGHALSTQVEPEDFKHFIARTITSSLSTAEEWKRYLNASTEQLFPIQQQQGNIEGEQEIRRTEIYQPSNKISILKTRAQEAGVSIDALLLAGVANILASSIRTRGVEEESSPKQEQVIFGVYLSNRAPFGSDLSSLTAPTLNLLPLRVNRPLEKTIEELARDIQRDLNIIGSKEMVGASLAEIYEWTGVRVDTFVNILRSANPDSGLGEEVEGGWKAVQDVGRRAQVVREVLNERMEVPSDAKYAAYLPSVDFELRYKSEGDAGSVDMGIFAPVEKLDVEGAEVMIERFLEFWR